MSSHRFMHGAVGVHLCVKCSRSWRDADKPCPVPDNVTSTAIPVARVQLGETCCSCETLRLEVMALKAQLRTRHPYAVFDVNADVERERQTRNGGNDRGHT